jgi:SAM-dependent methyltransferase
MIIDNIKQRIDVLRKLLYIRMSFKNFFIKHSRNRYEIKENYITPHGLEWWEGHINNKVLHDYSDLLVGNVADLGCNHGACTILAARLPNIISIVGIDINDAALDHAKKNVSNCGEPEYVKSKISFMKSNLTKITAPDNSFDSIITFHTLEHIYPDDFIKVISEIKRILKPKAHLVATTPYEHAYDDEGIQHLMFFNLNTFPTYFKKVGFEVLECYRDQRGDSHISQHDCLNIVCRNIK